MSATSPFEIAINCQSDRAIAVEPHRPHTASVRVHLPLSALNSFLSLHEQRSGRIVTPARASAFQCARRLDPRHRPLPIAAGFGQTSASVDKVHGGGTPDPRPRDHQKDVAKPRIARSGIRAKVA